MFTEFMVITDITNIFFSCGPSQDMSKCKNRYTAPTEDANLHVPHGVDLGGSGSPSQLGVTQWDGLSHSANCKATLERLLMRFLNSIYLIL